MAVSDAVVLPIDDAIPSLREALVARNVAVLEAPPGAGKTTRVPLALRHEPWLQQKRILMLEPRRLAARTAAHFMSSLLGESIGTAVGYRVRGESRISGRTRIEVVTEGVLTRLLSADASLEGYGAVIFDEFHERSLHADLGLALVLQTQALLREDLRVLVMSATLDGSSVAQLIGTSHTPAPVIRSDGLAFPVDTIYRAARPGDRLEARVSRVIREAIVDNDGDLLVFVPGAGEQRRIAAHLAGDELLRAARVVVHQLHGSMPLAAQNAAIAAAPFDTRKIVLATNVAETSLTIEGVRVVIDAGLARVPRYDARAGLSRLETVRVSRASADQRRGRAGRVAPGRCYRLWDAHEDHTLLPRSRPEIIDADLTPLALELADAGISDPSELRWLDPPRAGPFAQARELLVQLGALSGAPAIERITPHGQRMVALPLQPRLAHLMIHAEARGDVVLGAQVAALLEERDVLRGDSMSSGGFISPPSDMRLRVELLQRTTHHESADRQGIERVRLLVDDLLRRTNGSRDRSAETKVNARADLNDSAATGALLALAFPDRIAQRRAGSEPRYLLRNGIGASLPKHDALHNAEYLAVAELDGGPPEYRIARAAPITLDEIIGAFGDQIVRDEIVEWHEPSRSVQARKRTMIGAIAIDDVAVRDADPALMQRVLLAAIVREGIGALPWSSAAARLRERLVFLETHDATWPDVSDERLSATLDTWLAPHVHGMRKWSDLERVDWSAALLDQLSWEQRSVMDRLAPTHLEVPSGSRITLDYRDPGSPVLAVKLQEVFGWTATPMLFDGRVAITLHLLSPAQRPVQVTRDLAGFWRSSYFDVRKELRGRYPRHPWPDDPLTALPTKRVKPRGT